MTDRHIPLQGARNFRDFGGYPTRCGSQVKRGVLFRSDGLSRLSDEDLETLSPLGIRNICDLRRLQEREISPTRWHEGSATINRHLPLIPDSGTSTLDRVKFSAAIGKSADAARQIMIGLYRNMVRDEYALNSLQQIFRLIAGENELPLLVHCSGGKDRTGVSCALILTLLGVNDADVMEDYMQSQQLYSNRINLERAATQVFDHTGEGGWTIEAVRPVYCVEPAYLESALSYVIDTYGNAENFVKQALGLGGEQVENIRRNLIE